MIRKIVANILVAYILFPVFLDFRNWKDIINGMYKYEDIIYESFFDYLIDFLHSIAYPLVPTIFLCIVLLPFQLIKDHYSTGGRPLALWIKCLIFLVFHFIAYSLVSRGYMKNLWLPVILFAIVYTLILYYSVDRYVERPRQDEE